MKLFEECSAKAHPTPEQLAHVQSVIDSIWRADYYLPQWDAVRHANALSGLTLEEILKPFRDFWNQLPESKAIRRDPFFDVCDLAEAYCFGLIHDEADCDPVHEVDSPDDDPKSCYHC